MIKHTHTIAIEAKTSPLALLIRNFLAWSYVIPLICHFEWIYAWVLSWRSWGSAAAAKSLQSCPTLRDPIDGRPPGSLVPGILQARTLEWVAHFLLQCMKVKSEREVAQSCPPLRDPMDCSLPGSSVQGIFQARVLEWGAIAISVRGLGESTFLQEILLH